jgi:hypothetical protein
MSALSGTQTRPIGRSDQAARRLRTEIGDFCRQNRPFARKVFAKPAEKGRLSLFFLPRNERFQSLRTDFPSGLRRDDGKRRGQRAASPASSLGFDAI